MILLDANVLIAFLDSADVHHDRAKALLLTETDEELAASSLTLAEVFVGPVRAGRGPQVVDAIRDLAVRAIALPDEPLDLATLRARTGLRMPDCCVLSAALSSGARLATFDARLARAAVQEGVPVVDMDRLKG